MQFREVGTLMEVKNKCDVYEIQLILWLGIYITSVYFTMNKRIVTSLTLRLLSYIYGAPILDVSRSHTTTQHSR